MDNFRRPTGTFVEDFVPKDSQPWYSTADNDDVISIRVVDKENDKFILRAPEFIHNELGWQWEVPLHKFDPTGWRPSWNFKPEQKDMQNAIEAAICYTCENCNNKYSSNDIVDAAIKAREIISADSDIDFYRIFINSNYYKGIVWKEMSKKVFDNGLDYNLTRRVVYIDSLPDGVVCFSAQPEEFGVMPFKGEDMFGIGIVNMPNNFCVATIEEI